MHFILSKITDDSLLKCLQERVGSKPKFFFEKFQNWAENQRSFVISCYPETKDEMSRVIKAAAAESVGIRCAGARHSWAPVFSDTCQVCVNIKKPEERLLKPNEDQNSRCMSLKGIRHYLS